MSKRSITVKQANRMIRTARKDSARRVIPFSGVQYPRGTTEWKAEQKVVKARAALMRNVLWTMFLQALRPKPLKVVKL